MKITSSLKENYVYLHAYKPDSNLIKALLSVDKPHQLEMNQSRKSFEFTKIIS